MLPHGDAGPDALVRRVVTAEKFCADRGMTARFQIAPGACPQGLDAILAERGYRRESPMSLRAAPAARVAQTPSGSLRIRWDDQPTTAWFDVWNAVHGQGGDPAAEWEMLERVNAPSAYACAMVAGGVVAVARAVADTGWAGLFGMATLPRARGKGAARSVLAALAEWAGGHQADHMYLQVESDNVPALRLYERTGFSEVCGYHYRSAE
ncbi:GNAT family N-acetyltransferase [Streptomyces sp. RB6PN25]|uniref:GNAT family N-acetyltransferase n=1 Tax=Streptomyces humicola TaxID=2953240 RepID=A0ABT1PQJ1_9ACTN|nr:GNAT family N-acetyltransferase [Streptomyces humicola]MCQ4079947.1 GNAT family N-acetyltransferase [Streptomyces humicola]